MIFVQGEKKGQNRCQLIQRFLYMGEVFVNMAAKAPSIRGWGKAEFSQETLDTMKAVTEKSEIERCVQ